MDLNETIALLLGLGTPLLLLLLSCLCAVPSTGIFVWLVLRYYRRREAESQAIDRAALDWPETTGTVIESRTETSSWIDAEGINHTEEVPRIVYTYTVADQTYRGEDIRASSRVGWRKPSGEEALALVARFPVGAQVTVYYNPAQPTESALVRE